MSLGLSQIESIHCLRLGPWLRKMELERHLAGRRERLFANTHHIVWNLGVCWTLERSVTRVGSQCHGYHRVFPELIIEKGTQKEEGCDKTCRKSSGERKGEALG